MTFSQHHRCSSRSRHPSSLGLERSPAEHRGVRPFTCPQLTVLLRINTLCLETLPRFPVVLAVYKRVRFGAHSAGEAGDGTASGAGTWPARARSRHSRRHAGPSPREHGARSRAGWLLVSAPPRISHAGPRLRGWRCSAFLPRGWTLSLATWRTALGQLVWEPGFYCLQHKDVLFKNIYFC